MTSPGAMDEFALLPENVADAGLDMPVLPAVRRVSADIGGGQRVSALRWGEGRPQVVFLHGGGQNAHTWDTVVLALGLPALAVDLPGHGHSDWRADHDYGPRANAEAVAPLVRAWAPDAAAVVGMSLGGLTTIRLTATAPDLVRRAVVVDVTPSSRLRTTSMTRAERGTTALLGGPRTFATLDEMIEVTAAAAPRRPRSSIRRGVVHNTRQRPDGRWEWRYDAVRAFGDFTPLWDHVSTARMPLTLVRGGASAFVHDDDAEEFRRRNPATRMHIVPGAGHAVQSDAPLELTRIIESALGEGRRS